MTDLNHLSDEELQKIADGKMESLSDGALRSIAGENTPPKIKEGVMITDPSELAAAKQRQLTDNPESFGSKAKMAARALGSAAVKVGLPAGAIAASPFTGGGSLAALGAGSAMAGEYLGNEIAGEETTPGGLASAAILGATPMRSLPSATPLQSIASALKVGASGAAANSARIALDESRAPDTSEVLTPFALGAGLAPIAGKVMDSGNGAKTVMGNASRDADRRATLRMGRELGYTVPPSITNPNIGNDVATRIAGGKAATAQEAVLGNQMGTNAAARRVLRLSEDAPITEVSINTSKVAPNLVYDRVSKVSPDAADLLDQFKQYSSDEGALFYQYSRTRDPATLALAKQAKANAEAAHSLLSQEVSNRGNKTLMKEFDEARKYLAQISRIGRAYVPGTGNIDASVLGNEMAEEVAQFGKTQLTGDLYKVARFENAFGRYVREASKQPQIGGDYLKLITLPLAPVEHAARKTILSPFYQNRFAQPNYGRTTEDISAGIARQSAQKAAQQN